MNEAMTLDFILVLVMAALAVGLMFHWSLGIPATEEDARRRGGTAAPPQGGGDDTRRVCSVYGSEGMGRCPLRRGDAGGSCTSCSFYRPA